MDPKTEIIQTKLDAIDCMLDDWGFTKANASIRAQKKAQIIFWLENFRPSEISDALTILSKTQYKSDQVIRQAIGTLSQELRNVLGDRISGARFFQLGLSPSDSGGMYLYDYRKELGLSEDAFPQADFQSTAARASAVIFFDDIVGSGNQAVTFFRRYLQDLKVPLYYVAVFGFDRGVELIRSNAQFKKLLVGSVLSDEERAFAPTSKVFSDVVQRERLRDLADRYGRSLYPAGPLGYDDSQALVVFPHNTPNNTLPIFWASPNNEKEPGVIWNPVWDRRKLRKRPPNMAKASLGTHFRRTADAFARWQRRYVQIIGTERIVEIPLYAYETDWRSARTDSEQIGDPPNERRQGDVKSLRDSTEEMQLLLLAEAGRGKTTTLQFLAHDDAQEAVANKSAFEKIPIYFELKMLTGEEPLEKLLLDRLDLGAAEAEAWFAEGRVNLYLDGLNEVMKSIRQKTVTELFSLFQKYPRVKTLITSRPQQSVHLGNIPSFLLQPFSSEQTKEFLSKNASTTDSASKVWQQIQSTPRIKAVVSTPLFLFMLLNVIERTGVMPPSEALIIRNFIKGILSRESEKDPSFDATEYRLLLQRLATLVLELKGSNVPIYETEALELLTERKRDLGLATNLIEFLRRASELGLLAIEEQRYSFTHPIFQDYFAAEELATSGEPTGVV